LSEKYLLFITDFINLRAVIDVSKDILKELNINFKNFINDFLISLNKHTLNYDEYIKNYHLVDKNITSNQKVVNIIKKKFKL
jgi:hypothetical protein